MTRVVSERVYPLPADTIESETMSMSESKALAGTETDTPKVVVSPTPINCVMVESSDVDAHPRVLDTEIVNESVELPVFRMM